ncbi:reverse transcriptase domain-containing protein [Tanacetum coccineum]
MPFGLKNAGATYQRLVDRAFDRQIGQNLEIYMDDLVIKSYTETELLRDIEEMFHTLRKINIKHNPKKCMFGAAEGMFLGYMISLEGIKPCSDKTEAVLQLPSLRTIKEVQSLNGKLASLNIFLSKSAFKQLKQHLAKLPMLVAPKPKEELMMYLSASYGAISAVLMTERDTVQTPVYFVSQALQAPEINYTPMEKLGDYKNMKGQILADFLVEKPDDAPPEASVIETPQEPWTLFTDGSSCVDGSGAGLILTSPEGTEFTYALRFQFAASNNEAEYKALIARLRIATRMGVRNIQEEGPTWMTPIIEYLRNETLLNDRKEASKLRIKARQYELLEGILYRRSFLKPWLRCVGPLQADYVIREIHEGSCNTPSSAKTSSAAADPHHGPMAYKWGIDIAGPFLEGPRKVKFLIVAMDYFTKWIEAKAVVAISGNQVKKFLWDNIVCRFGLPEEIVSENGKQFSDDLFKDWCKKLNIVQRFASVKHPQSNRLVERANRSLGEGIKARLGKGNKNWLEELSHVLWAHHTMIKSSNDDTPFSLTHGTEVVIPAKIGMPTYHTAVVDAVHYNEELRLNLDLLEERRERATICEAKAKSKMIKYYNARVIGVTFRPGDFVYRSNDASHAVDGGKLGLKWEGPYEVTKALGDGAYKLRSTDGTVLPRTWNIPNLKKCYI